MKSILISITILAIGFITLIYKPWRLIGREVTVVEIGQLKNRILVPVEINGHQCLFLWDTGADYSMVSQTTSKKCGVEASGEQTAGTMYTDKIERVFEVSKPILLSFGRVKLNTSLTMNPYSLRLDMDSVAIDGILGQDVISRLYWQFDFDTNTAIISNKDIHIDQNPDFTFTLFRDFNSHKIVNARPYGGLSFNDSLQIGTLFDSGMNGQIFNSPADSLKYISTDLLVAMPDSLQIGLLKKIIECQKKPPIQLTGSRTEGGKSVLLTLVADSLRLNDKAPAMYLITPEVNDFHKIPMIIITANFMRRFGRMYYDPFDRKIEFYKSPKVDGNIYSGKNILVFFEQHFFNNNYRPNE